jgi:hypothetical protein
MSVRERPTILREDWERRRAALARKGSNRAWPGPVDMALEYFDRRVNELDALL